MTVSGRFDDHFRGLILLAAACFLFAINWPFPAGITLFFGILAIGKNL